MKNLLIFMFCAYLSIASAAYLTLSKQENQQPALPVSKGELKHLLPKVDFVKEKVKRAGSYRELIISSSGIIALQRVAHHEEQTLTLLEITNGTLIIQLIFMSGDELVDCDVTNTIQEVHKLAKHINSKSQQTEFVNVNKEKLPELNLTEWVEKCTELHENQLEQALADQNPEEKNSTVRNRRALSDLIYPGTKWCGRGNSAKHYYDLGEQRDTDKCCRDHDSCTDTIPSLSYKYNYFNYGLLTISNCNCDERFKSCLKTAKFWEDDSIADMIGYLYFNVLGMTCFKVQPRRVCKQSSWWGRCTRYGHEMSAIFEVSTF